VLWKTSQHGEQVGVIPRENHYQPVTFPHVNILVDSRVIFWPHPVIATRQEEQTLRLDQVERDLTGTGWDGSGLQRGVVTNPSGNQVQIRVLSCTSAGCIESMCG
jgi:hypothetical protein